VFVWLVTRHSQRLYAPKDFRNEDNWVKMQLQAAASLAAAKKSDGADDNVASVEQVVEVVRRVAPPSSSPRLERWRSRILWVDDRPENNIYERRAFEALGFSFVLALSTAEALEVLESQQFAAIISDIGRKEGPKEGY
jgi:PleD family two-component response regulator